MSLLDIMPVTQFEFPEEYEYLAGFGVYLQYVEHWGSESEDEEIYY